jgi:hypothetical protein
LTTTTRWTIGVASIVLAIVGYVIGAHAPAREQPAPVAEAGQNVPRAPSVRRDDSVSVAPGAPAGPRARYAELSRRAESGDREAAAALATMLQPCTMRRFFESEVTGYEAMLDEDAALRARLTRHPNAIEALSRLAETSRASAREAAGACEGLTPEQVLARGHWLYRAAELGDAASALEFGRGDFLRYEPLTHLDEIAFWRDHAEAMLQQALAGGESGALAYLAAGYERPSEPGIDGPHFVPDPVKAYTYYTLLSLTSEHADVRVEGSLDRLERQLSDADRARARAAATDICIESLPLVCDPAAAAPE